MGKNYKNLYNSTNMNRYGNSKENSSQIIARTKITRVSRNKSSNNTLHVRTSTYFIKACSNVLPWYTNIRDDEWSQHRTTTRQIADSDTGLFICYHKIGLKLWIIWLFLKKGSTILVQKLVLFIVFHTMCVFF